MNIPAQQPDITAIYSSSVLLSEQGQQKLNDTCAADIKHDVNQLMALFNKAFIQTENTQLIKGNDEPIYLPKNESCPFNQIIFAHGYFSSALHEVAHWCIAGKARRELEDYGYWYEPDGRNEHQQTQFEQVEIKPQAIEWAFCIAAKKRFNVSADNLNGAEADTVNFTANVFQQVKRYLDQGFPPRAQLFINVLAQYYQHQLPLTLADFQLDKELYGDV